ncbi:MAG: hypothetical protein ACRC5A_06730, partial [Enterobacteriaceae bacterium]
MQNNLYTTTLSVSGQTIPGTAPIVLFGVKQPASQHYRPIAWRSQGREQHEIDSLLNTDLIDTFLTNTVTEEQFRYSLKMRNGNDIALQTQLIKQAQIMLQRPATVDCQEMQLDEYQGKNCLIRTITITGDPSGGDIQFVMRSHHLLENARYRIGQQWYPLGTPIPVAEFTQGRGIELFIPSQAIKQIHQRLQSATLTSFLEAGFYSPSRYSQGDKFSLLLSGQLPSGKQSVLMSRLGLVFVDDQVTQNRYVSTTSSHSSQTGALLYGASHADSASRPAIWYSRGIQAAGEEIDSAYQAQLAPASFFAGFSKQGVANGDNATFSPMISDAGWQKLLTMAPGDGQLLQYGQQGAVAEQRLMSNIVKEVHLELTAPATRECHSEQVKGIDGEVCTVREVNWSGTLSGQDSRFVVRTSGNLTDHFYRTGNEWIALNNSIPLSDMAASKSIDIFYPKSRTENIPLQMQFFSAQRLSRGDRLTLKLDNPKGLPPAGSTGPLTSSVQSPQSRNYSGLIEIESVRNPTLGGFLGYQVLRLPDAISPLPADSEFTTREFMVISNVLFFTHGYLKFMPSGQETPMDMLFSPTSPHPYPDTNPKFFTAPKGTTHIYVYVSARRGAPGKTPTLKTNLKINGKNYSNALIWSFISGADKNDAYLSSLTASPQPIYPGAKVKIYAGAEPGNIRSTLTLQCRHIGLGVWYSMYSDDTYNVYSQDGTLLGSTKLGGFGANDVRGIDFNADHIRNGKKIYFTLNVVNHASTTLNSTISCNLANEAANAMYLTPAFADKAPPDNYAISSFSATDGVEQATAQAVMTDVARSDRKLYYEITPQGLTADELKTVKLSYRNLASGGITYNNKPLSGVIDIALGQKWEPQFTVTAAGIDANRLVNFKIALDKKPTSGGSGVFDRTATMKSVLPPRLTFSFPTNPVVARANEALSITLQLNRMPVKTDTLLFRLVESVGTPELVKLLDLTNATLSDGKGTSEKVNFTKTDDIDVLLQNFKSDKLTLSIPGKMPSFQFTSKTLTLWVNDKRSGSASSGTSVTGKILPFTQQSEITKMTVTSEIEKAFAILSISGTPYSGQRMYYRFTFHNMTDEEKKLVRLTHHDLSYPAIQESLDNHFTGDVIQNSVLISERPNDWRSVFTITAEGLKARRDVTLEFSLDANFNSGVFKETATLKNKEKEYKVESLTATENLQEKVIATATMSGSSSSDQRLLFQIHLPATMPKEDREKVSAVYRNALDSSGKTYPIDKAHLDGEIPIGKNVDWKPEIIVSAEGISAEYEVTFKVSLDPNFGPGTITSAKGKMLPSENPMAISKLTVSSAIEKVLATVAVSGLPYSGQQMYYRFTFHDMTDNEK